MTQVPLSSEAWVRIPVRAVLFCSLEMTNAVLLLVLIGIPGAGKSSLLQHLTNQLNNRIDVVSISLDDMVQFPTLDWNSRHAFARLQVRNLIQKAIQSKDRKTLIIIDDNHYYRSMRYSYFKIAKICELFFVVLDSH
jgi:tRNA uridine 5-carbamoylmethylation protein Kti12